MSKLEIGDKVTLTEATAMTSGFDKGIVFEVKDFVEEPCTYNVVVGHDSFGETWRELFQESELVKVEEIKVGDIVFFREGISIKELFLNALLTKHEIVLLYCNFMKVVDIQDKYWWEINGEKKYGSVRVSNLSHSHMIPISYFTKNREERIGEIEDEQIKEAFK